MLGLTLFSVVIAVPRRTVTSTYQSGVAARAGPHHFILVSNRPAPGRHLLATFAANKFILTNAPCRAAYSLWPTFSCPFFCDCSPSSGNHTFCPKEGERAHEQVNQPAEQTDQPTGYLSSRKPLSTRHSVARTSIGTVQWGSKEVANLLAIIFCQH